MLFVTLWLAGCGGAATQPPAPVEPVQTQAPVQPTAPPPEVTEAVVATEPPAPTDIPPTVDINCTETNPHPLGQNIADTYGTSYEEVMTFFCTGVPFDDITLAYETAKIANIDVTEAMTLWYDYDKNWDDVWAELGIQ